MYQTVPVTCPNCNHRFASPVLTIIDVGQYPEAKSLFLAGQINIAVCPQCGHTQDAARAGHVPLRGSIQRGRA